MSASDLPKGVWFAVRPHEVPSAGSCAMTRPSAASLRAYAVVFEPRGRVIACRMCAHAVPWRGHDDAHRDGWRWELGHNGALLWTCGECIGGQTTEAADGVV